MSTLRELHIPGSPLILPNAWDAATAKLVAEAGFPVVATSSGAVAGTLGYTDNEGAPAAEMFAAAARMVRAVNVPVTVDAESGYGLPARELAARLIDIGAKGCNLEDTDHRNGGLVDAGKQAERLAGFKAAAGQDFVLNARVDTFLRGTGNAEADYADALTRAKRYVEAGADCIFPIFIADSGQLKEFISELAPTPVNVLYRPGTADMDAIIAAGAARISLGGGLFLAMRQWLSGKLGELPGADTQ
jgi:2-methylisocitrate lyase-like PEP mutase family enzyme